MNRLKLLLPLLAAILAFTVLSVPAHARETRVDPATEMTVEQAGDYYLKHWCAKNPAAWRFDEKVWRGEEVVYQDDVRRRLPLIRRESRRYGKALYRFAVKMLNPPAAWPAGIAAPMEDYIRLYLKSARIRLAQGQASNALQWLRQNDKANKIKASVPAIEIRAGLALPPPNEGC